MKKSVLMCFLFFLATNLFIMAEKNDLRPMTTDDALNMVRVSNAMISPDGQWIFFSKSELDWKNNKRKSKYYFTELDGNVDHILERITEFGEPGPHLNDQQHR